VPELPEVETIVRQIRPRLTGRTVRAAALKKTDVLRAVSRQRLLRTLRRNRFTAVERRAKHAVLVLASGHRLIVQPGMTGSLIVHDQALTEAQRTYAVLICDLDDNTQLVYRDVRRLGTLLLLDQRGWVSYSDRIGPEPLDQSFTPEVLRERITRSRQAIKKVIMDQGRVAGIGNIYANEALFLAGIDPSKAANRLSGDQVKALHRTVQEVLEGALRASGTTFRDYRTGTGERGSFQFELKVYGRGGEPCVRCGRRLVTTHAIDSRATTFCPSCQS
jgi:formamidopyrimidine-DNA glycosylase